MTSVQKPHAPRRFRLLPEDGLLGWTPYLWLGYFPTFFIAPYRQHASALEWAATIAAGIIFVALYFRGYWARGREFVGIVVVIALLGFAFVHDNAGASVFLTYAGAFAGVLRPRERAIALLAVLAVAIALVGAALGIPPLYWIAQICISLMIGAANIHSGRVRELIRELGKAREEKDQLVRVAERERIARDLHDVLGHTLTLITLKSALAARIAEREPARAAGEMREIERVARDALADVRAAVTGYRGVGLANEVESAEVMLRAAGVAVERDVEPVPLTASEETTLALAIREAVTNVVRHAGATLCRITLQQVGETRALAVEDDGRGKRGPDGNGLAGMRERVHALGGQLEVGMGVVAGTCVRITLGRHAQ